MKLTGQTAKNFFIKPDEKAKIILLYGSSISHILYKRDVLKAQLLSRQSEKSIQIIKISAEELKKEPSRLLEELNSTDLFCDSSKIIVLENATDSISKIIIESIPEICESNSQIIITAGALTTSSQLKKYIEFDKNSYSIAIYDDGLNISEINSLLEEKKIFLETPEAKQALFEYSRYLDPFIFVQNLEKLSLYTLSNKNKVSLEEIEIIYSDFEDVEENKLINYITSGNEIALNQQINLIRSSGKKISTITFRVTNYFRTLHKIASHGQSVDDAFKSIWPPLFGFAKENAIKIAKKWGVNRIEKAIEILNNLDYKLRTQSKIPESAIIERTLIEISTLIVIRDLHSRK